MPRATDRPGRVWLTGALAGAAVGGLLAAVAVLSSPAQATGGIPTPCDDNVTLRLDDVTYDLQGTYTAAKAWRLTLGAKNLFDTDPPYTNSGGQTSFQGGYDPQYADPRGRFIYARVTYLFQ